MAIVQKVLVRLALAAMQCRAATHVRKHAIFGEVTDDGSIVIDAGLGDISPGLVRKTSHPEHMEVDANGEIKIVSDMMQLSAGLVRKTSETQVATAKQTEATADGNIEISADKEDEMSEASQNESSPQASGDTRCYIAACGCPGAFRQNWCTMRHYSGGRNWRWCASSRERCENNCNGVLCSPSAESTPAPTDAPAVDARCYIAACGCPGAFRQNWCTMGHYSSGWCASSRANCENNCNGVLCSPSVEPTYAPTDAPTDEPTDEPTDVPTDGPTDAPTSEAPTSNWWSTMTPAPPGATYSDFGIFQFNVDIPGATSDVGFIHSLMNLIVQQYTVPADSPKIMLGFSGGSMMASLMGCFDPSSVYSAQVAVHYDPNATWPQNCTTGMTQCPEFMSVGDRDYFIAGLTPTPAEGYANQFAAFRDTIGCPAENPTDSNISATAGSEAELTSNSEVYTGGYCRYYQSCPQLGKMCMYNGLAHATNPHITSTAWSFLTSPAGRTGCSRAGSGDTPSFTASGAGTWTGRQSMQDQGRTRYFDVYVPNGTPTGIMFFLHGTGMFGFQLQGGGGQNSGWHVQEQADRYGFIGVVPLGLPLAEVSEPSPGPAPK